MAEDSTRIPLYGNGDVIRAYALVDPIDAAWISQWRWNYRPPSAKSRSGYAVRELAERWVWMHRLIAERVGLALPSGMQVDHVNRDGLDNRRTNLRAVTAAQNNQNRTCRPGSSRHRGVYREATGKWCAETRAYTEQGFIRRRRRFDTEQEAAEQARTWRAAMLPYCVEVADD